MIFRILFGLLFFASALSAYTIEEKLLLEQSMATKSTEVLENILGKGKVISYVEVELETTQTSRQREVYDMGTKDKDNKWLWNETDKKYILPGYSAKDGKASDSSGPSNYERTIEQNQGLPKTLTKRIRVNVLVDNSVEEKLLEQIPRTIESILGINRGRGDVVSVGRIAFSPPPKLLSQFKKPELLLSIMQYIILAILSFLGLTLLFYLSHGFVKNVSSIVDSIKPKMSLSIDQKSKVEEIEGSNSKQPNAVKNPLPLTATQKEEEQNKKHFGFINSSNLNHLIYLLKKEYPGKIALILPYLDTKDASFVLAALPPAVRANVVNLLTKVFETSPDDVNSFEKVIKEKIDYLLGGDDFMLDILNIADAQTRESLLTDLGINDPQKAFQLRGELFLFEDIFNLSNDEFKRIIERVTNDQLATAFYGSDEKIKEKLFANMSDGGRKILSQTIDLMGTQSKNKVTSAQEEIIKLVRGLMKEGLITKRKSTANLESDGLPDQQYGT